MNKEYFIELFDFNVWANTIVCNWLEQITDRQWNEEINSSFNSVQKTVLHCMSAENAWLQRLRKNAHVVWLQNEFEGTRQQHIDLWKEISAELHQFVKAFAEQDLNKYLDFRRINGDAYSMPYYQVLAHLVNHNTYHRGQLVTMLRQVGFKNVESTDLLGFYRTHIK